MTERDGVQSVTTPEPKVDASALYTRITKQIFQMTSGSFAHQKQNKRLVVNRFFSLLLSEKGFISIQYDFSKSDAVLGEK